MTGKLKQKIKKMLRKQTRTSTYIMKKSMNFD